ncbi:hypothetical protein IWW45_000623, partial [Coemansia sp. RSA 485]
TKSVFDPKPKRKPRRIPIAKRKGKRKTKREAEAAAPPKQLSDKRPFADVDSGSDDEVPPIRLRKDVRRRG